MGNKPKSVLAAHQPPVPISPADPLFTSDQASAYFGGAPSSKTLEYYRAQGIGPDFVVLARRIYYRRSALDAYLDRCTRVMKHASSSSATDAA